VQSHTHRSQARAKALPVNTRCGSHAGPSARSANARRTAGSCRAPARCRLPKTSSTPAASYRLSLPKSFPCRCKLPSSWFWLVRQTNLRPPCSYAIELTSPIPRAAVDIGSIRPYHDPQYVIAKDSAIVIRPQEAKSENSYLRGIDPAGRNPFSSCCQARSVRQLAGGEVLARDGQARCGALRGQQPSARQ